MDDIVASCLDEERQQADDEVSWYQGRERKEFLPFYKTVFRIPVTPGPSAAQLTLDSLLLPYRRESTDPQEEIHVQVEKGDLLHAALKVVARPNFSFRKTPVVSGEGTDCSQPIREFFRQGSVRLRMFS